MKKNNTKELLISILESQNSGLLLENGGATGDNKPVAGKQEVDDPDKNVANPNPDELTEENYGGHDSLLFLTAPNSNGIIKSGENMGWIELTKENISKNGIDIDLVDFQWVCPTSEFNDYLKNTGRYYDEDTGKWAVREEEEYGDKTRKINSYDDFISEKLNRKDELNELDLPLFGNVSPNRTEKGMAWQGDDPDFQGGKLNDAQRKFVKFYFARNHLRNIKALEYSLDLTKLNVDDRLEIFICPFDAKTGKSDTTANIGVTFRVTAVIEAEGDIKIPMIIGIVEKIAPNIGKSRESGVGSVLDDIVKGMEGYFEQFKEILSSSTGILFVSIATVAAMWTGGIITGLFAWKTIGSFRRILKGAMIGKDALEASKLARSARKGSALFRGIKSGSSRIFNFIKYPVTVVKNIKVLREWNKISKGTKDVLKGWKAVNQILYGHKALKVTKAVTVGAKILKGASTVGKWSNPIGWALLIADGIGSALNYTSDKQAPSWDPILGGEGDALLDYKRKGITPNATNVFKPGKIANGESITLCWTQSPEDGWGIALSFVASNTTRTTMNITKIHAWNDLSMFLVNSINYEGFKKQLEKFDLKFLFIQDGTYEEGYADDNIPAVFLGAKANPKAEGVLPIAYYAHCDFPTFASAYESMADQLVVIPEDAPDTYNFYFEDSESNIINVYGKKVSSQDIENASQEEIRSFFDVQPVSSLIGNPESETEEEKEQRKSMENSAKSLSSSEGDGGEGGGEDNGDLTSEEKSANESYDTKWYSAINESKPVTSFDDFKSLKESILLEDNPPLPGKEFLNAVGLPTEVGGEESEGKKPETQTPESTVGGRLADAKEFEANFESILQTIDTPMAFCIYFVELREYADPKLRDTYKPGSFMNFTIDGKALSASDDSNIEGHVQVNNLDVLLEVRKGTYTYTEKDNQEVNTDSEENGQEGSAEGGQVRTSLLGKSGKISIDKEEEGFAKKEEEEKEIKSAIQRVSPDELSKLDIDGWQDVTSVKIIRDKNGEPETVKIKNAKADLNDKSRRFDRGDAGFEEALRLSKAYQDQKSEEEERLLAKR